MQITYLENLTAKLKVERDEPNDEHASEETNEDTQVDISEDSSFAWFEEPMNCYIADDVILHLSEIKMLGLLEKVKLASKLDVPSYHLIMYSDSFIRAYNTRLKDYIASTGTDIINANCI